MAVISDGTRVLGMGDIGPKAGLPVMEGKSLLFKYLGGVDGFPLMVDTKDPDKLIRVRQAACSRGWAASTSKTSPSPSASASSTRCARSARSPCGTTTSRARPRGAGRPDQRPQGGRQAHRRRRDRLHRLRRRQRRHQPADLRLRRRPGRVSSLFDSKGILHKGVGRRGRKDEWVDKWKSATRPTPTASTGGIADALRGADVCIALASRARTRSSRSG